MEPELVVDAGAEVGEGPVWDPRESVLWWVDIPVYQLHRFDPRDGSDVVRTFDQPITAVGLRESGGLIAATSDGFGAIDTRTLQLRMIAEVDSHDRQTRMNDGRCDPAGRFWAGTMALNPIERRDAGSLYRLDIDGSVHRVLGDVTLSNGIDWSPDGRTMYFIDSLSFGVDAFDFDSKDGRLSNRRRLVTFPEQLDPLIAPDGMCVDAEGYLWVAMWGGSSLLRIAPDGTIAGGVQLPLTQVTSCAFGGGDYQDLYITTASQGLSAADLQRQPHAGGLFRISSSATGRPANFYLG